MPRPLVIALVFTLAFAAPGAASDLRHLEDATLRSIYFIDDKEGWIAGDEGVILHTLDAGTHWQRQATGTRASLRSVQFLSSTVGWAAGREEIPYGMGSVGVLLYTNDGGLQWKRQLANTLPGLNQVRFVDGKVGYLLGDGSDQFPSGVFRTTDSGRSWEPVPGFRTTSWLSGDFYDAKTGILAGAGSRFATLRGDKITLAEHAGWLAGRDVNALRILGRKSLAVAQGGLVLTSVSGGAAWDFAKTGLATEVLASLDFHALHAVKDKVWLVGRPGSVIVHSADGGSTWKLQKTGQSLPLHGVYFFDEKLGWAVGDAGTIVQTSDGGKSWTTRHQAGQRLAALCLHSLNKTAPVDTIAHLGGAEGYLTAGLRIGAPDPATLTWSRERDPRRYAAAIRLAGGLTGETLWHFPLPQYLEGSDKKTILAHWNQAHAGRAEEELIRQLVLSLRTWRPSVLISEFPQGNNALPSLLNEAVQEAVGRAANPKAFPEHSSELGLEAWTVRRVFGSGAGKGQALTQDNEISPDRLTSTVRDFAASAHGLLVDRHAPLPRERKHALLFGGSARVVWVPHWLTGLEQKVGESRRDIQLNDMPDVKLHEMIKQRRTLVSLAENLDDPAKTLALIPLALDKLPDEHAASAAFAIAGRFAERGQWYLAQEVYLYLVDRYPAHPLSADAYRWLIQLNTSREARRRNELKHFAIADPIGLPKKNEAKILRVSNEDPPSPSGRGVGVEGTLTSRPETREWNKGSLELSKRLGGYGPIQSFDPRIQFCLQSARRQLGDASASHDWMTKYRKFVTAGPWHEAALAENWLGDRSQPAPRKLARTRYTEARPFLDGKFDDPCWQDCKSLQLSSAVGETAKDHTTEAMFAFDQEFLYIALKCMHPTGKQVAPVKPRPRDAEVDGFDRVSILLDLDRDYSTYYHLEIDQRGCLRDSCWGDRSWNPRWFAAVHSTETCWQIEAAIPLGELSGERISALTAWAFNVVRIIPGQGVQSWSLPADVEPRPEGMSLMLFDLGKARPMPMP